MAHFGGGLGSGNGCPLGLSMTPNGCKPIARQCHGRKEQRMGLSPTHPSAGWGTMPWTQGTTSLWGRALAAALVLL